MKNAQRKLWAIPILIAMVMTLEGADQKISGRVLDPKGRPVPGVEVATFWSFGDDGKLKNIDQMT